MPIPPRPTKLSTRYFLAMTSPKAGAPAPRLSAACPDIVNSRALRAQSVIESVGALALFYGGALKSENVLPSAHGKVAREAPLQIIEDLGKRTAASGKPCKRH